MAIKLERRNFISSNKQTNIVYARWVDEAYPPKAILLIAHGMAEYIERYDNFARYLARHNYAIYGNDHLGHGQTAKDMQQRGYFGVQDGRNYVVDDIKALCGVARNDFPGIPVILLGHSMGSFVARIFCGTYGDAIDAAIFMGTGGKNPAAGMGILMVNMLAQIKGELYRSKLVDNIAFGGYNKHIPHAKTKFDWLSTDPAIVQAYVDDENCGFLFTLSGYRELFRMLREATGTHWTDAIRRDLPVLVISGREDPVGSYGKGVQETYEELHRAGMENIAILLYDTMRHEVLNEIGKEDVYEDILAWCNEAVGI